MANNKKLSKEESVGIDVSGNGNIVKGNVILGYKKAIKSEGNKNILKDNFGSNKIPSKINKYVLWFIVLLIFGTVFLGKKIDVERIFLNVCNKLGLFFKEPDTQKLNVPNQQTKGIQSPAINIQGSQNTNININYPSNPNLMVDKIKFGERYAYEFDNYLDSENKQGNTSRIIENNSVLRKHFNPSENVKLTPAIVNLNEGIPLEEARIQFVFGQGVIVTGHEGWTEQEVNNRYSCKFSESINNTPLNTEDSIFLRFIEPGRYQIKVLIDGKYLKSTKEVNYFIDLYK